MAEKENKRIQAMALNLSSKEAQNVQEVWLLSAMSYEHNRNLYCQMGSERKPQTLWCYYAGQR